MVGYTIDQIIEGFLTPIIKKTKGQPTRQSIEEVEKQLQNNVACYLSELGGGEHGFLGLVMTPELYDKKIKQIPWNILKITYSTYRT